MSEQPADIVIQHVSVEPDGGLQVGYYRPSQDVYAIHVLHMHTLCIPAGPEYDDEIRAVHDALQYLVADVLDDLPRLLPMAE